MPEVPKLLVEVNNLPRIRKYNIISKIAFEKGDGSDVLFVHYTSNGIGWSHGFDAGRSDFEEQVAEWVVESHICETQHFDYATCEYDLLSDESKKAIEIAKIQINIKKSIKEKLDKTLEQLKDNLRFLIDTAVDEVFKTEVQNEKEV